MKSVQILLTATAALALMAASTLAADMYIPVDAPFIPEASAPISWTGAYVGVNAGHGWGETRLTLGETGSGVFIPFEGWLAGGQVGYNVQLDGFVVGVEGDLAWTDIAGSGEIFGPNGFENSVDWLATLRGRIGLPSGPFLAYGTAGVAFTRANFDDPQGGSPETDLLAGSDDRVGWVVGAGVETMVSDGVSLKAEYLYHGFGEETLDSSPNPAQNVGSGLNISTTKIGLNFHF